MASDNHTDEDILSSTQVSVRTDDEFRRSRRNLLWIGVVTTLFALARTSSQDTYDFAVSVGGFGIGFHRGLLAVYLLFAVLFFTGRFWNEYSRIRRTLNSQDAISNFLSGQTADELASLQVRKRANEHQAALLKGLKQLYDEVNTALDNIPDMETEIGHLEEAYEELERLNKANDESMGEFAHVARTLDELPDNPMGFALNKPEREALARAKAVIAGATRKYVPKYKNTPRRDIRQLRNELTKIQPDARFFKLTIELDRLRNAADNVEQLNETIRHQLESFEKASTDLAKSEKVAFTTLDLVVPNLLALLGAFGCAWWIIAWIYSN